MDFGGPSGIDLSRLKRIVAYHDDLFASIKGFAFFYADGITKTFGTRDIVKTATSQWTCIEQSYSINGPEGEIIIKIDFQEDEADQDNSLRRIKVSISLVMMF